MPRCTTCNECVNLNPRAFAYDENRQAFLKDPRAATYKELVEAAENCQSRSSIRANRAIRASSASRT